MNARLFLPLALFAACTTTTTTGPSPTDPALDLGGLASDGGGPSDPALALDAGVSRAMSTPDDPYLWLEEVAAEKPLAWARTLNERSTGELVNDPRFPVIKDRLLSILNSKDKLPYASKMGKYFYNFWQDEKHVRGLWRRVPSLAEYKKAQPNWETVLDVDALGAAEKENWVYKGSTCLYPDYTRCLVTLSRGGADASVVREFDMVKKVFVEGGFSLPEAKSQVSWKDLDTVYVGTDFGPGTLTDSGYPRQVREWKRGTPLASATLVYEGKQKDVWASGSRSFDHGRVYDVVSRGITFFSSETFLLQKGALVKIEVPDSAQVDLWDDQLVLSLRDDWKVGETTWPKGSLLVTPLAGFLAGERKFTALFTPTENSSLSSYASLKSGLVTNVLVDVHNVLTTWTRKGTAWTSKPMKVTDTLVSVGASAVEPNDTDELWVTTSGFTQPTTLSFATVGKAPQQIKQSPTYFDARGLVVEQHFATSKDGTRVPYFQVSKKALALDGSHPTLLTGYGGFEISLTPAYNPSAGSAWLEKGGVLVQANIRGGGEYGPRWHQAALKLKRQAAYDDFAAVAQDLVTRKVTSPAKLGAQGGSNGGLLVGVMLTQKPELFGAIVCQVPLLDMKRYAQLLAGASWMGEYGDPTVPEEWAAIARYSPYQNVKKDGRYPRTLFTTSTRDDRVHPGHARKMVARMTEQGHDVLYYENIEGGHGGAANNEQRAFMSALAWTFLARQLGL